MSSGDLKHTRAVHRALDILERLGENGASSLHALHLSTGLSKSTLRRLLVTLAERGYIRRGLTDRMYRSNIATPLTLKQKEAPRMARLLDAARPHMIVLTRSVGWPVGLHYYIAGRMRIIETTHGMSPFGNNPGMPIDSELNIFASASGLAWLAANDDATVLEVVETLADGDLWSLSRYGISPRRLVRELAVIRRRGWAKRRAQQGIADNRVGAAIALHEGQQPVGALTLTWQREAMTDAEFAVKHLGALTAAAVAIDSAL
ncbi:MAG: helix-turn-helix domain-containing protein [Hyphomicrobiaceae bacterium]